MDKFEFEVVGTTGTARDGSDIQETLKAFFEDALESGSYSNSHDVRFEEYDKDGAKALAVIVDDKDDYQAAAVPHENPYAQGELTNILPSTEASVKKVWEGNGTPPETLKVILTADGEAMNPEKAVTLSAPSWEDSISNLPKYTDSGEEIEYIWQEEGIHGYFLSGETKDATITTITNIHVLQTLR